MLTEEDMAQRDHLIEPEHEALSRAIDTQQDIIDNDPDPRHREAARKALGELLRQLPPGVGERR